ncbi:hypothetical protein MLD52_19405 [Puniceicoccaceae bacterium K14]|nr:hypothetical protein [Puniceicoccaceae bacterium K14]
MPVALVLAVAPLTWGQVPFELEEPDVPFDQEGAVVDFAVQENLQWKVESALRALRSGLPDLASGLAEDLLAERAGGLTKEQTKVLHYTIIDSKLAMRAYGEAELWLEKVEKDDASYRLRKALVSFGLMENAQVYAESVSLISEEELSEGDRAWLWMLRGWVANADGETDAAAEDFARAKEYARDQSPDLAAQIEYLEFRAKLLIVESDLSLSELESAYSKNRQKLVGYRVGQVLALLYFEVGQVEEALAFVDARLSELPIEFGDMREQYLLLKALIAGVDRFEGRSAARELIANGENVLLMRVALRNVFRGCLAAGDVKSNYLNSLLSDLIDQKADHILLDELLYYRSVSRFMEGDYDAALRDANLLQSRYVDSPYQRGMLSVLASSEWQRSRFRTAASHLSRLRAEFAVDYEVVELSSLIADCYFRAGLQAGTIDDFSNAAEAYGVALAEMPAGGRFSRVYSQLVSSYLRSGDFENARGVLDSKEFSAKVDDLVRWRAEWKFLTAMRSSGRSEAAYDRAQAAVRSTEGELKLRFLWLASKLSLESGHPSDTENWVLSLEEFLAVEGEDAFDGPLIDEVRSSALMTQAEAEFSFDRPEQAVAILNRLREEYAGYDAALLSYLVEARYLTSENRTVEAQRLLVYLADNFKESRYAPMALFEAALNAERRGQDSFLDQAKILLERIAQDYPDSEMVYYARLRLGDLLRKLNQFSAAQQMYEHLENQYRDRADRYLAQISLADALMARAIEDPSKFEAAISRLELLLDLPDVPLDLRVEAGYKLGVAWQNQGETRRAKQAFWTLFDVVNQVYEGAESLGPKGNYWYSRSLFALADISKFENDVDGARKFYGYVVSGGLWGEELARAQLDRLASGGVN